MKCEFVGLQYRPTRVNVRIIWEIWPSHSQCGNNTVSNGSIDLILCRQFLRPALVKAIHFTMWRALRCWFSTDKPSVYPKTEIHPRGGRTVVELTSDLLLPQNGGGWGEGLSAARVGLGVASGVQS